MSNRLDSMVTDAVVTNSSAAVSGAARASNLGPSRLAAKYMRSTFGQLDRISARHSPSIHGNHQYLAKVTRCSARNTGRMLSRTIAPLMNKAILDDHSIRSRGVAAYPYRRSPTQITTTNSTSVLRTRLRLKAKIIDAHSPIWAALHPPRDGTSHRPVELPLRRNRDSKFRW